MKKRMKWFLSILMVAALMVAVTACGNKKTEKNDQTTVKNDKVEESSKEEADEADTAKKDSKEESGEELKAPELTKEQAEEYRVAVLKGPTGIGFVKAWEDSDNGETINQYHVTAYGAADEITAGIAKGTIDIAAVPCNLASVLYAKTDGDISIVAINTLGVLSMITASEDIHSVQDLKGKTIYTTGQGTTPEYVLNYVLEKNGLTPGEDVKIEYRAEAAEASALMVEQGQGVAMLPQPYVSTVLMKNENMKVCLDMTEEWNKVSDEPMITGVVIARNEVIEKNKEAFTAFLKDYQNSINYVKEHTEEAAKLVDKHDIIKEAVAKLAIPECNITFIAGDEMKKAVDAYLNVLFEANPQSVGGVLPDEHFYYVK